MIGAPVTLTSGDKTWTLTPEQIVAYMDFTSEDDERRLHSRPLLSSRRRWTPFFDRIADEVATEPVDATFKSDGKKAWVVPGVLGREARPGEDRRGPLAGRHSKTTGRTAEVAVKTTEPELTTEEAEAMGIKDLLATYTTAVRGHRQPPGERAHHHPVRQRRHPGSRRRVQLRQADRPAHRRPRLQDGSRHRRSGQAGGRVRRRHLPGVDHPLQRGLLRRAWKWSSATTTPSTSTTTPRAGTPR